MRIKLFLLAFFFLKSAFGQYQNFEYDGINYGIFKARPSEVQFHWKNNKGEPYRFLNTLRDELNKKNQIKMLMNAGIFSETYQPSGLWIENGIELKSLNTRQGTGNFHIQPNGVFLITHNKGAMILTTEKYQKSGIKPKYAVQSGPMLIIHGKINPLFKAEVNSPYKRNAVCITEKKALYFIMTIDGEPNFHSLASALIKMGCREALYLDGSISSWYIPEKFNAFHWVRFVGMISVSTPKK